MATTNRFAHLSDCLSRAARAPGLRADPGLVSELHAGERQLRELRQEHERLARVRDAFANVRMTVGEGAPVEQLQAALLEAYQRAAPHLNGTPSGGQ